MTGPVLHTVEAHEVHYFTLTNTLLLTGQLMSQWKECDVQERSIQLSEVLYLTT